MGLKSYSPHNWGIQSPINPLSKSKQPRFFDESHGSFGFSGRCKSKVGISRSGPFCAPRSGGEITPGKQPMYKAIYRGYKSICNYGGFPKWWYPTTTGFPAKNDQHLGCEMGVPPFKETRM